MRPASSNARFGLLRLGRLDEVRWSLESQDADGHAAQECRLCAARDLSLLGLAYSRHATSRRHLKPFSMTLEKCETRMQFSGSVALAIGRDLGEVHPWRTWTSLSTKSPQTHKGQLGTAPRRYLERKRGWPAHFRRTSRRNFAQHIKYMIEIRKVTLMSPQSRQTFTQVFRSERSSRLSREGMHHNV